MKFVQFRLHSIILNYNYFVHNSVDKLLIFFPIRIQLGGWGAFSANMYEQGGGGSKKGQFYANVIIEWSPMFHYVRFIRLGA